MSTSNPATKIRHAVSRYSYMIIGIILVIAPILALTMLNKKNALPSSLFGFNEGYGTAVHDTENLATGTITNAVWKPDSDCLSGNCLFFDGSADYISFGDNYDFTASDNWSIDFWFRTTDITSGTRTFISKYLSITGTDGGYKIYMNSDGTVTFAVDDDNIWEPEDYVTSPLPYDDNKWHHLEITKSGTSAIKLYMDAELISQDTTISSTGTLANTDTFYVGIDNNGLSNPYTGFIDELKIHTTEARTAEQVKTDYVKGSPLAGISAKFGPDTSFLTNGLVGYWKLDEYSSGNGAISRYDGSGNTNTLSDYNNVASNTGVFGLAADFNAASEERLDIPSNSRVSVSDEDLTISAWVYLDLKASNRTIISKYRTTTNAREFILFYNASTDRFAFSASADGETETTVNANTLGSPSTATWYHVAGWHDSTNNTIGITVNGDYTDTVSHSGGINSSGQNLIIGAYRSAGTKYDGFFDGRIDEVRMYKTLLSPEQIMDLYDWIPGPVGWYKMDNTNSSQLTDYSSNAYHGTISSYSETSRVPGKYGKGLKSDGTVGGLEMTIVYANNLVGSSASSNFTMETFIYLTDGTRDSYPQTAPVLSRYGLTNNSGCSTSGGMSVQFQSDSLRIPQFFLPHDNTGSSCHAGTSITGPNLQINTWNHLAATYESATKTMKLYTNGILSASTAWGGTSSWSWQDNTMYLNMNDSDITIPAVFDEVKFYNYIRDSGQIVWDMNAGHPVPGSPVGSATANWKLDEGSGTVAHDAGTSGIDLTLSSERWTSSGKFDMAFDGGNGERLTGIESPTLAPGVNEDFSISAWFRSDSTDNTTTQYLITKGGGEKGGYQIYFTSDDNINCAIDDDNFSFPEDLAQSTHDYYDTQWHQVVCIRNITDNKLYLYIDGNLERTDASLSAIHSLDTDTVFYVNDADNSDNGNEFTGDVDEIKLYRLAFTPEQTKTEYNRGMSEVFGSLSTDASGNPSYATDDSFCPPGQGSQCVPPVGYWNLDGGNGTSVDKSGNNNNLTNNGSVQFINGRIGKSSAFDGSSTKYLAITDLSQSDLDITGPITVEAWYYMTGSISAGHNIVSKQTDGDRAYRLSYEQLGSYGVPTFSVSSDGSAYNYSASSGINVSPDTGWHHLTGVYDGTSVKIYIDGVKSGSTQPYSGTIKNSAGPLRIGTGDTYQNPPNGLIDDVRIYDYARTDAQVAWDYNLGTSVAWYKLDDCSGTVASNTALDASGKVRRGVDGVITIGSGGTYSGAGSCSGTASEAWKAGAVGKFGSSLGFDDVDDYISVTDNNIFDLTNGLSLSFWVKTSSTEADNVVISKGSSYEAGINGDGDVYWDGAGDPADDGSAKVTSGTWHHVVITNNDTTAAFYVDGRYTNAKTYGIDADNNDPLYIGYDSTNFFDGLIDNVQIFPYVINAYQVRLLYNGGSAVRL